MELLIILGVVLLVMIVVWYNKLVRLVEATTNAQKEISVQLDRRGKVFDSLIATVTKYMDHENSVLTKVTELRQKVMTAASPEAIKSAEQELSTIVSSGQLTSSLNLTVEAYPELKSNTNMLQLQEEIVSTENKLSFAKKGYNNALETYNSTKKSVPYLFVVKLFSSLDEKFEYWSLTEEQVKVQEEKRISF